MKFCRVKDKDKEENKDKIALEDNDFVMATLLENLGNVLRRLI